MSYESMIKFSQFISFIGTFLFITAALSKYVKLFVLSL